MIERGRARLSQMKILYIRHGIGPVLKQPMLREFLLKRPELYKVTEPNVLGDKHYYPEDVTPPAEGETDHTTAAPRKPAPQPRAGAQSKKKRKRPDKSDRGKDL